MGGRSFAKGRRLAGGFWSLSFVVWMSAFSVTSAGAGIVVDFDGGYNSGIYDWWKWENDPLGGLLIPSQVTGRGGTGWAQRMRVATGTSYLLKTMPGLTLGQDYEISVWVRTFRGDDIPTTPRGWVEFGWDLKARDSVAMPSNLTWCSDPGADFVHNLGKWVQYTGEPFTATSGSITVAFRVGSVDPAGIVGEFDDLAISEILIPPGPFPFPDHFDTTYTVGSAYGWNKRLVAGGAACHWARATGRSGWAQHLYAGAEPTGMAVNMGVVKTFQIQRDRNHTISLWVSASDSLGNALTNPNPDVGPIVKWGVDPSAQTQDSTLRSILWNSEPTQYFSVPGLQNTWRRFFSPMFRATTDTVSVWLWVQGDNTVGVSAKFDDLVLETGAGSPHWKLYR